MVSKKNSRNVEGNASHTPNGESSQPASKPISIQQALQVAIQHHQEGQLTKAEALYRQVIAIDPENVDANHLLGVLANQVGAKEVAIQLIQKAIQGDPELVDAHYNLGNIFRETSQWNEAIDSYRKTLSIKPGYAKAHYNLGIVFTETGNLEDAIKSYENAIVCESDYIEAYNNLGLIFKEKGQPDKSISYYEKAISINPKFAEAHNNLGDALEIKGQLDQAINYYRKAIVIDPNIAEFYFNLGKALRVLGQFDEAIESYQKAISINPEFVEAYQVLSCTKKYTELDEDVKAMQALYDNKNCPKNEKIPLSFGLGKVFEDMKEYEKSFDYYLEGNRLKRSTYEYSISKDQALFNKIKEVFVTSFFTTHSNIGNLDDTPIFILGMPRSGTSLVEQILASHPQVFGAGELHDLSDVIKDNLLFQSEACVPESIVNLNPEAFMKLGADYIEKLRKHSKTAEFISDKMPGNFIHIGLIKIILPNAKIIHCMRDPMDTCFSIFKNYFSELDRYAYNLTELGQHYNLYQDLMAHWQDVLPDFIYNISYEKLISDQENQSKKLLEYCGLPWDDACLSFHKTKRTVKTASTVQVRQPLYKDSVQLWKRYEVQLGPLYKELCG